MSTVYVDGLIPWALLLFPLALYLLSPVPTFLRLPLSQISRTYIYLFVSLLLPLLQLCYSYRCYSRRTCHVILSTQIDTCDRFLSKRSRSCRFVGRRPSMLGNAICAVVVRSTGQFTSQLCPCRQGPRSQVSFLSISLRSPFSSSFPKDESNLWVGSKPRHPCLPCKV